MSEKSCYSCAVAAFSLAEQLAQLKDYVSGYAKGDKRDFLKLMHGIEGEELGEEAISANNLFSLMEETCGTSESIKKKMSDLNAKYKQFIKGDINAEDFMHTIDDANLGFAGSYAKEASRWWHFPSPASTPDPRIRSKLLAQKALAGE